MGKVSEGLAREFGLDPLAWNKVPLKGFMQVYDMRVLEFQRGHSGGHRSGHVGRGSKKPLESER